MSPENEIRTLRRRYERFLRFDRAVCVLYCFTAAIPIYYLFSADYARSFHALGAVLILAVGVCGAVVDTRVLRRRIRSEVTAYSVTAAFLLSRIALSVWGILLAGRQIFDGRDAWHPSSAFLTATLELFFAPPIVWLGFFAAFYRVLYHISVHFLLKIQQIDTEPNQPVQSNSVDAPRNLGGVTAIPRSPRRVL